MAIENMNDLFVHTLKDTYYAENRILKALPMMAQKASSEELRDAFETHVVETQNQVERLKQVFAMVGEEAAGEQCPAMDGIITESEKLMEEITDASTLDAAMIAAAQAVEHYEITRYGTLVSWAESLGYDDAIALLTETLEEEKDTDEKLSDLAESNINPEAIEKMADQ